MLSYVGDNGGCFGIHDHWMRNGLRFGVAVADLLRRVMLRNGE